MRCSVSFPGPQSLPKAPKTAIRASTTLTIGRLHVTDRVIRPQAIPIRVVILTDSRTGRWPPRSSSLRDVGDRQGPGDSRRDRLAACGVVADHSHRPCAKLGVPDAPGAKPTRFREAQGVGSLLRGN